MSEDKEIRVLHFINQFFAGIGGEAEAGHPPELRDGPVGPGTALTGQITGGSIVATLICGDNFFQEETVAAEAAVREAIERIKPDVVISGPAFVSGRYGLSCGAVAEIAQSMGVPSAAAMSSENPAVSVYGTKVYTLATGDKPIHMRAALQLMGEFARKLGSGAEIGPAVDEGYLPRGERRVVVKDLPGHQRAVDMLVAKLSKQPFKTEIPYQPIDRVAPRPAVKDITTAKIALVSTGGLIRKGNPDNQTSSFAKKYLRYDVTGMSALSSDDFEADHAGYFNETASQNPNVILPLSYARDLERRGEIGSVYNYVYGLPGVGTAVPQCQALGKGIAAELLAAEVDACLLVST